MSNSENNDKELLEKLAQDFHTLVSDKTQLHNAVEHFFDNLVDEITLGIIFQMHRKYKTNFVEVDPEIQEKPIVEPESPDKKIKCVCLNCKRLVAAEKFAPHLAACMGLGRQRRAKLNRDSGINSTSTSAGTSTDDEFDVNFHNKKKRNKKPKNINKPQSQQTIEQMDENILGIRNLFSDTFNNNN